MGEFKALFNAGEFAADLSKLEINPSTLKALGNTPDGGDFQKLLKNLQKNDPGKFKALVTQRASDPDAMAKLLKNSSTNKGTFEALLKQGFDNADDAGKLKFAKQVSDMDPQALKKVLNENPKALNDVAMHMETDDITKAMGKLDSGGQIKLFQSLSKNNPEEAYTFAKNSSNSKAMKKEFVESLDPTAAGRLWGAMSSVAGGGGRLCARNPKLCALTVLGVSGAVGYNIYKDNQEKDQADCKTICLYDVTKFEDAKTKAIDELNVTDWDWGNQSVCNLDEGGLTDLRASVQMTGASPTTSSTTTPGSSSVRNNFDWKIADPDMMGPIDELTDAQILGMNCDKFCNITCEANYEVKDPETVAGELLGAGVAAVADAAGKGAAGFFDGAGWDMGFLTNMLGDIGGKVFKILLLCFGVYVLFMILDKYTRAPQR